MTETAFELEWYGGMPAARLRRRRGDVDALPWGTLRKTIEAFESHNNNTNTATIIDAARRSYTEGAWNEYRAAASFTELSRALLRARAPIDLVALAADFVVDEMSHVELNARMAMELGGAEPIFVDFDALVGDLEASDPIKRAVEIAVRISCVGEALSGPLLATAARSSSHPLTKSVLRRLASEEGAHGAIGWMVLEWAAEHLSVDDRERLAKVAADEIEALFADWAGLDSGPLDHDRSSELYATVGFALPASFLGEAQRALRQRVAAPLARHGIIVDTSLLDRLAAPQPTHV